MNPLELAGGGTSGRPGTQAKVAGSHGDAPKASAAKATAVAQRNQSSATMCRVAQNYRVGDSVKAL
jgi:hypothetical protein